MLQLVGPGDQGEHCCPSENLETMIPQSGRIAFLILFLQAICANAFARDLQKVTLGIQVSPALALVMVAKDKGFFEKEGLDVELKQFTAGKFALQAFLTGSIDYAVSGEVPVCLASLQGNEIRVVSQVVLATTNEVRVVARREDGLTHPSQYFHAHKRKLATSFGGGPEFFTYNFLKANHIGKDDVELISQRPEDMPATLQTGSVDAISIFDPFAFVAEKALGSSAVTFTNTSGYSELYVLDARPEQTGNNGSTIESMLRAMKNASGYIAKHPESTKQIVQNYTKLDQSIIDGIWKNFSFKPYLGKKLIRYWNAEAAWAKETGKVSPDTPTPNFRTMIEDRFLKKINPSAVRL